MTTQLKDRVALVTGAGRGIGREIALAYAAEGADLVLLARTRTEIDAVAAAIRAQGRTALPIQADVTDEADIRAAVDGALRVLGRLDVLVNNAGITPGSARGPINSLLDVEPDFWDATFAVNCRGPFLAMRAVLPIMVAQGGGVVLTITSRLSCLAVPGNAPYGPSKAAVEQLTRIVDTEFRPAGVRANLLHPGGPVATTIFNEYYQPHPGTRVGSPGEICGAAVWLVSDESADVHGALVDARDWNSKHGATPQPHDVETT